MSKQSNILHAAIRADDAIEWFCKAVILASCTTLLLILAAGVFTRYVTGGSLSFAGEIPSITFPFFVMAGIALAARRGNHVATQFMLHALPGPWARGLTVLIHVVTAAVYLLLAWYAADNALIAHDEKSTVLRVPGSVGFGALATGLALVGLCSVTAIVRQAYGQVADDEQSEEATHLLEEIQSVVVKAEAA